MYVQSIAKERIMPISLATEQGKEHALEALRIRRENRPEKIDNASLVAGMPMYFYCHSCGHCSDILPESYTGVPKKRCRECQALQDLGWLE